MNTKDLKNYINEVLGDSVRCLLPSFWWKKLFGEVVDTVESVSESTKKSINSLSSKIDDVSKNVNATLCEDITYKELCKKVEDAQLVPGQSYRIIDYECTVNDVDPDVVAKPYDPTDNSSFCIVVTALTKERLCEDAHATHPSRLISEDMSSWELKYTLNNYTYPWGRVGKHSYDVYARFKIYEMEVDYPFYWEESVEKYTISKGDARSVFLVNSMTDKTPLQQTTFNYGDTVYVYSLGTVYESPVLYTDSMKDTGDGVLAVEEDRIDDIGFYYPYIWDDEANEYIYKASNSYAVLYSADFSAPLEKQDHFEKSQKFGAKTFAYPFYEASVITDYDVIFGYSGSLVDPYVWDNSKGKYINVVNGEHYLVNSNTDKTPLSKKDFSVGEVVYFSDENGNTYSRTVLYTKDTFGSRVLVKSSLLNIIDFIAAVFTWNTTSNSYYSSDIPGELIYENGNLLPQNFNFNSNESFGIQFNYTSYEESVMAVGFYIPDGKGVVYYMKDGNGNEAHYDFKSIMFKFPGYSEPRYTFNIQHNDGKNSEGSGYRGSDVYGNKIGKCYKHSSTNEYSHCLNKVSIGPCSNTSVSNIPRNVVISGNVYNMVINHPGQNVNIGLNSSGQLTKVNIHDKSSTVTLDSSLSTTSTNGIQNKVVAEEILKLTCNFILPANNSTQLTSSEKTSNKNAYNRYINATNKPCVSCSVAGIVRAVPFRIEVQNNALHLFMFDDIDNMGDLRNVIVNSDGSVTMTEYNGTINTSDSNIIFYLSEEIDTPLTEEQIAHNIEMFNKVKNATYIPSASFAIGSIINDKPAFTNHTGLSTSYFVDDELGEIVIITCFIGGAWQEAVFKSDGTGEINN